jgi:hypothetical protein
MPGHEERTPSDADRAPASRVGDELQKAADELGAEAGTLSSEEVAELERDAKGRAEDVQWDQAATAAEGTAAAEEHTPSPAQAAQNREDEPPA